MRFDKFQGSFRRKTVGVISAFLFCVIGVVLPGSVYSAKLVDRIVAVVNEDVITLVEVNENFQPYLQKIKSMGYPPEKEKQMVYTVRENIINELIDRRLTTQEVKRANVSVSEKEIDAAIERMKEANLLTDEKLRQALAQQGLSMEQYREQMKDQILRTKLLSIEVKSKIVITDEEIKSHYEKHAEKYGGIRKYHLRNIMMKIPSFSSRSEKRAVLDRMNQVHAKLAEGEPFEALARSYSEAPTAETGGDLGRFTIETLSPRLQKEIKGLKSGEFTPVIETDQGYQIFYVQDIVTTPGKTLKEVSAEIQQALYKESVNKKFRSWIEELRTKSHIKIIK